MCTKYHDILQDDISSLKILILSSSTPMAEENPPPIDPSGSDATVLLAFGATGVITTFMQLSNDSLD